MSILTRFGYNNLKQIHKFQGKIDEPPLTATSLQRPFFWRTVHTFNLVFYLFYLFVYSFLIIVLFKSHC